MILVRKDRAVGLNFFFRRTVRCVCREGCEIEKKRLCGVVPVNQPDGFIADLVCKIAFFLEKLTVSLPVDHAATLFGEVVDLAHEIAVEMVESTILWPIFGVGMAKVPLADNGGLITHFF